VNPPKGIVTALLACGLFGVPIARGMKKISYAGYRFPPEIIQQAIWLYLRFTLSLREVEDLLAERGISVSYETVRRWVNRFGPMIAADLRKRRPKNPHRWPHGQSVASRRRRRRPKNSSQLTQPFTISSTFNATSQPPKPTDSSAPRR
jgi:hypothetical protein